MRKKIVSFLIVGIFVLSGLGAGAYSFDENTNGMCAEIENSNSYGDDLDQSQTNISLVSEGIAMPVGRLTFEKAINFQISTFFMELFLLLCIFFPSSSLIRHVTFQVEIREL